MFRKQSSQGSVIEPASSTAPAFAPAAPGQSSQPLGNVTSSGMEVPVAESKSHAKLILSIALALVSAGAIVLAALLIGANTKLSTVQTDIDGQIDAAVAIAVANNTTQMEAEFAEREKYPYRSFAGPADYGSLTFEYPQTWSVYVAKDAVKGGDFEAYLNPLEVEPISNSTVNALRVSIRDTTFDRAVANYDSSVKNGKMTFETREVGGIIANLYKGKLLTGELEGAVAIFKLRDKTVILQTDSMLFLDEFNRLLDTVTVIP